MYRIRLSKRAAKDLDKLHDPAWGRLQEAVSKLRHDPRPHGSVKLVNVNAFRIRVGDYRVVYDIDDAEKIIKVHRIRHRRDVYKDI